jgi:hypothetical protein
MGDVSLEFLAAQIAHVLEELAALRAGQARIEKRLGERQDKLNVVSGLAMRATGQRIAWGALSRQIRRIEARLTALEEKAKS